MMAIGLDGWLTGVTVVASEHHNPRPIGRPIDMIVVHAISLPPEQFDPEPVLQFFTGQLDHDAHPYFDHLRGVQVSSHFYIARDGGVVQLVSCDERAWHAGASHWAGFDNCNDNSIGIELAGSDITPFTDAQYAALGELITTITSRYTIAHLVGHDDIAPGRKTDPGPFFDWSLLCDKLKPLTISPHAIHR
jgi:N-acetyl-anhydromuramoyl-L-alanine amidase